jgi:GNAT superfamily N-acetyltransferase
MSEAASCTYTIRRIRKAELHELIGLCAEHAAYERADFNSEGKIDALRRSIFATGRLHAWVAEAQGRAIGYATATLEFSTWKSDEIVHMDCLFVAAEYRGTGAGSALFRAVLEFASEQGVQEVQWQTPDWNVDAMRFYRRKGAAGRPKVRFTLPVAGKSIATCET